MRRSTTTTSTGAVPVAALIAALLWLCAWPAWAQAPRRGAIEAQILEMHRDAMVRYDELEFEQAKELLREALALAAEHGLEDEPILARVYADLAVVYASGLDDEDGAERALTRAVEIDPAIEIDPAYKSKPLDTMLASIKRRVAAGGRSDPSADTPGQCREIAGIVHEPVAGAEAGQALEIQASVSPRLRAKEVRVHYRVQGRVQGRTQSRAYAAAIMEPIGRCRFAAELPGSLVRGPVLDYYVAAYNASSRVLAESGSADAPHAVIVRGEVEPSEDVPGVSVRSGPRLFLGLGGGSAGAYLRGSTEQVDSVIQCCLAPELVHARVEAGFYVTESTSVSVALRMGFPLGANLPGHAVAAPALLLRLRHALAPGALGLQLSGVVGVGYSRHTVGLAEEMSGGDTDTAAAGPLLAGAGVGYVLELGGPLRLATEVDVLVGVPVVANFVGAETVFGVNLGGNVALQLAF
jgi:hypothetical protein